MNSNASRVVACAVLVVAAGVAGRASLADSQRGAPNWIVYLHGR